MDWDRPVTARLRLEHLVIAAVLLAALLVRLVALGHRPLHHDESIHAYYSWRILTHGPADYRYDPVYHGPALYYGSAALLGVLGGSDAAARAMPVLCSLGLVALAWPLRTLIGRNAAFAYAILAAFSPTLVYYGRSLRHDVPMAFFTFAAVIAFLLHRQGRHRHRLYLSGLFLGLAAATKEDIYLTAFAFANALWILPLWESGEAGLRRAAERWVRDVRDALVRDWAVIGTGVFISLTVALVLYTSLLTRPENGNFVGRAIGYWWGQHKMQRIGGPFWYYLPFEIAYEALIFVPALLVVAGLLRRRAASRTLAFFATWTVLTTALYAWAQEKVPWLLVPALIPQSVLAATWYAENPRRALWMAPAAVLSFWSMAASSFLYDAPRPWEPPDAARSEPLVYVQTTYDVPRILASIEDATRKLGTGTQTPMVVVGDATWPLSWYLRDHSVHWGSLPAETSAPVVIVDPKDAERVARDLGDGWQQQRFAVRGWWQIEWSRFSLPNLFRFLFYRIAWNPPGTTDAVLFLARDLSPGAARTAVSLSQAPPVRTYPSAPERIAPLRVLGVPGNGPGQLREPRGLAFDLDGRLLVADSANHRIQRLDPSNGRALDVWGGPTPGDGPAQFQGVTGIAVGPDEAIYVADTWNHRIQKLSSDGTFLLEWRETEDPGLWGPRALAVADDGTVFVADTGNKRILAYGPDGVRRLTFGGGGSEPGQLIEPVGLAIDRERKLLYVADTGNHRIQRFDLEGRALGAWPAYGWEEFYSEPYLAWAPGLLVATDSFQHRINVYDRKGRLRRSIGGSESGLNRPIGVAISPQGEIFASDTMNHRIVVIESAPDARAD